MQSPDRCPVRSRPDGTSRHGEFPKQDRLGSSTTYGNFINAPLFGALVPKGRTVFLDENLQAHPYQWAFLEGTRRVSEQQLDQIIERNGMAAQLPTP